jgi:RNA polymerase sigma-70 factor, ECF subfamily
VSRSADRFTRAVLELAAARGATSPEVVQALRAWAPPAWARATGGRTELVPPERFADWLGGRIDADAGFVEVLTGFRLEESYLACACGSGEGSAIVALEERFGSHLEQALRGIVDARSGPDDIRQLVRVHLFVGEEGRPPAIERYSGRGSLAAWLRVTCKRVALNAVRRRELPQVADEAGAEPDAILDGLELGHGDPELRFLKDRYRHEFRGAFADALGDLDVRQRTLVRLAAVDGASVRDIGRMYGVHHATAARWVTAAYDAIVERTKARLAVSLRASPDDVDSILSLIKSRLDASLGRIRVDD